MTALVTLLGHRIGYSASPAMVNAAFSAAGIDAQYELRDITAEELPAAVKELRSPNALGANVTQPHKVDALDLVDDLAPDVERVGALNTIVRRDERLMGHNTDLIAIVARLAALAPDPWQAVVLGDGGASRAVVIALTDAGAHGVNVVSRFDWHRIPELLVRADLLVNATPIGTASDESPIPAKLLRPDLRVLDLVYRPSPTRLVREARAAGAPAEDGAAVLHAQAAASFELWTGRPAPLDVMRAALDADLETAGG
ncbi:MAG: shikimate dehydrogenase [Chloroflexota bacterium]|nr:shikimate dehydrogenase [Chloroflexota bacterium]